MEEVFVDFKRFHQCKLFSLLFIKYSILYMLLLTHLIGFGLLSFVLNIKVSILGFIFSVLPDIDNPSSIIGQMFPKISTFLFERFGHRGLTHSIIPLIILGIAALYNADLLELFLAYFSGHFLG